MTPHPIIATRRSRFKRSMIQLLQRSDIQYGEPPQGLNQKPAPLLTGAKSLLFPRAANNASVSFPRAPRRRGEERPPKRDEFASPATFPSFSPSAQASCWAISAPRRGKTGSIPVRLLWCPVMAPKRSEYSHRWAGRSIAYNAGGNQRPQKNRKTRRERATSKPRRWGRTDR